MRFIMNAVLLAGLAVPFAGAAVADDKKADQKAPKEVADPVCGMMVDPKTADKADYKGKTYYFCSADEKQEFLKTPEKFLPKAAPAKGKQ
jgi:YHS domain-containing protein